MTVIDKLRQAEAEGRCSWSFEYFPPKTEVATANLFDRIERMSMLGPEFIDVTWGAGGWSSDLTFDICATAQNVYGIETCMHLTCTNMPREKIDKALSEAKACGIRNILALRGDPPRGSENWTKVETGFAYAVDLVRYIRQQHGDYFCIGVAGYPENHPDSTEKDIDLIYLQQKVDAGADYVITQLFYDVDIYLEWLGRVRDLGISVPILPGIMPIQAYGGFQRMTTLCKTNVPQYISDALAPIKDDDEAVKNFGVRLAIDMCDRLREAGVRGFHFYTMNLELSVRLILEGLGFVAPRDLVKPLPWNPSLDKSRENETVRPIFWRNRPKSYIARTESWDEYPNGRWGDSRSPAYGEIGGYGVRLKYPAPECLRLWGHPETPQDMCKIFTNYVKGSLSTLPWSDTPLQSESDIIRTRLIRVNTAGFLTINSQPAVDGALSSDRVYGWGPKNGFVFQKAYIEFFVSSPKLDILLNKVSQHPFMTYHAVNKHGDLRTNTKTEAPNAVTWGVFPGKEILQPTVVEGTSFLAWKDEAFELWNQWGLLYPARSPSKALVDNIASTWFLVNIVDNNFKNRHAIFDLLDEAATDITKHVAH